MMERSDLHDGAVASRLRQAIVRANLSYGELGQRTGIPKSAVHRYVTGMTGKVPIDRIQRLAAALGVSPVWLMGGDEESEPITAPHSPANTVPLLGTIACGTPILAQENWEGEIALPADLRADFALRCRGDSMTDARINDGDIVYVRRQEQVEDGEIAAVLVGDEATLKRVYVSRSAVTLVACNAQYPPMVFREQEEVRILGKAVGFFSVIP